MRKEIWKFDVLLLGDFKLTMPWGAKILTFQMQQDTPRIWVLIDWDVAGNARETREFTIQGTGIDFYLDKGNYIGTIQRNNFVWHLFEVFNK